MLYKTFYAVLMNVLFRPNVGTWGVMQYYYLYRYLLHLYSYLYI